MIRQPKFNNIPRIRYNPHFCDDLIKHMKKGLSNLQIAAKLSISEKTFYSWKQEHPEFQEAFEIGNPQRFDYLMEKADQIFLENQNDKGYKHWLKKIQNIYRDYAPDRAENQTTNNIQIGNMNVLNTKSESELLEILQDKYTQINKIKPLERIPQETETLEISHRIIDEQE